MTVNVNASGVRADGAWTVYAGDRNRVRWQFVADGAPRDLTGATITAQARKVDTDATPALTAEVEPTDLAGGTVHIGWDGDAIRTLLGTQSTWTGEWDLQLLEAGETLPDTIVRAPLLALMDVTREAVP